MANAHFGTPDVVLEPIAQAFIDALAAAGAPPISRLTPHAAREVLNQAQGGKIAMPPAEVEEHVIPGGPRGEISITVVRPLESTGAPPVVLYVHGGGWALGNFGTHERLVRELATRVDAAVVFVNYTSSPEAHFPTAIEEVYAAAAWVAARGAELGLDGRRLAVVGDSVGGNLIAAVTILAKERGGPTFRYQVLFYPVTSADLDSSSYQAFANGPWLTRDSMRWFWDQYAPDQRVRDYPLVSPLRADLEQLAGLPPALVITAEADVLRDEGEAYGRRLRQAGVDVTAIRYGGAIHDFVMLNAVAETNAARSATAQAAAMLASALAP
jgi:acetyl esterase